MRGAVTAALALLSIGSVNGLPGQTIENRVADVRDGFIRLAFAAREGVCGSGENGFTVRGHDDAWEPDCGSRPVLVMVEKRNGDVVDIDTYVGGRWRQRTDAVDLGVVSAPEAARFFLQVAHTASPAAESALLPAALADSVIVWPQMSQMARDQTLARDVREKALFWTGQLGDDTALDILMDFLRSETDQKLRNSAVFAVSQHGSDRATTALRDIAESPEQDRSTRERAIFWLGQRRGEDHRYLRDLYASLRDDELKERVIFSVSQNASDEDWRWLLSRATSGNETMELRKKALFWAGQSRHDIADLVTLYDRLDSSELKERLLFVFSQKRGDEQALDKLIRVARDERDRDLRRKAIFWLGQSNDPRAVQFLSELIG